MYRYSPQVITALLQTNGHNFTIPPTVEDLLSGKLQLILPSQAQEMLGIQSSALYNKINVGYLAAIKFVKEWRLSLASLHEYLKREDGARYVHRPYAAHALGVKSARLEQWVYSGDLQCARVSDDQRKQPITIDSFLRLLERFLPDWFSAYTWLKLCLNDPRPLMLKNQLIPYLGLAAKGNEVQELITARRLAYLQLADRVLRFLPASADSILQQEGSVSLQQVAFLFGVNLGRVYSWVRQGILVCKLHHAHPYGFYRACILQLLGECLTPAVNVRQWFNVVLRDQKPLLDISSASKLFGTSESQLLSMLENGTLAGLCLPESPHEWRIPAHQLGKKSSGLS
jgi:hypothetical protein